MSNDKPIAPAVEPDGIPFELRQEIRWLPWKYILSDDKWRKVPINPRTGRKADATNPDSWVTFKDALAYYQKCKLDGIGIVLGDGLAGVDLDDCGNPDTDELAAWASGIVYGLGTYTDISPSNTGVKLILRGQLPDGHRCRKGAWKSALST